MSASRRLAERALAERREFESRQNTMNKFINGHNLFKEYGKSTERVDFLRRAREMDEIEGEFALAQQIEENERQEQYNKKIADQREKLATELANKKREVFVEEKIRQKLASESDELKELRAKLNAALVGKERRVQMEEKRLLDAKQAVEAQEQEKEFEKIRVAGLEAEAKQEDELKLRQMEARKIIDQQLAAKQVKRQEEYEQFLLEKQQVDNIISRIKAEDDAEQLARVKKAQEDREFVNNYMKELEEWRNREKERQEEENRKLEEYAENRRKKEEEEFKKREQLKRDKDSRYKEALKITETMIQEKEDYEQLRNEVKQAEEEELRRQMLREEEEKKIRMREEMRMANEVMMKLKAERDAELQQEEEEFRRFMLAKFEEDARIEQMTQQKRMRAKIEYRHEIDSLVEQRRAEREAAEAKEKAEWDTLMNREAEKARILEEERRKLIREYAVQHGLLGHLPAGVLKDEKDLEMFDDELRKKTQSVLPEWEQKDFNSDMPDV